MTEEIPVLDQRALERTRAMMGLKFGDFIQLYVKCARTYIAALKQTRDSVLPASEAILTAHSLKSSSAQVGAARVAQACDIIEQQARALASQESVGTALAAAVHRLDECYVPSRATVIARYRGAGRVKLQPRSRTSRGSAVTPDGGDAPTQPFAPAIGK